MPISNQDKQDDEDSLESLGATPESKKIQTFLRDCKKAKREHQNENTDLLPIAQTLPPDNQSPVIFEPSNPPTTGIKIVTLSYGRGIPFRYTEAPIDNSLLSHHRQFKYDYSWAIPKTSTQQLPVFVKRAFPLPSDNKDLELLLDINKPSNLLPVDKKLADGFKRIRAAYRQIAQPQSVIRGPPKACSSCRAKMDAGQSAFVGCITSLETPDKACAECQACSKGSKCDFAVPRQTKKESPIQVEVEEMDEYDIGPAHGPDLHQLLGVVTTYRKIWGKRLEKGTRAGDFQGFAQNLDDGMQDIMDQVNGMIKAQETGSSPKGRYAKGEEEPCRLKRKAVG